VKYELGFYIPEDAILHSHRRENLKSYNSSDMWKNAHAAYSPGRHSNQGPRTLCGAVFMSIPGYSRAVGDHEQARRDRSV
jgi:hypothetical protein